VLASDIGGPGLLLMVGARLAIECWPPLAGFGPQSPDPAPEQCQIGDRRGDLARRTEDGKMLRKVNKRREGKAVTYAHIIAGCKAFDIMHDAGLPENLAIRSLRDMINVYASEVHHGREVMVSVAARGLSKSQIILEHGTPRTELTRLFLKAYHAGELMRTWRGI
jgi:hypothetical protein